jgi:hypothetical protein
MAISTFFILTIATVILAVLIRLFWVEILVVGYTLYILGYLGFYSLIVAIFWAGFVTESSKGFGLLWLYIFLLFAIILTVYVLIVCDVAETIINFFKRKFN